MPVSYFRLLLTCSFALWNLIAHSGEGQCKYELYVPLNAIGKMNLHYVWKLFSSSQYLWYAQRDCRMNHPWAARLHSETRQIQSCDGAWELFSDIRSVTIVADSICGDVVRAQRVVLEKPLAECVINTWLWNDLWNVFQVKAAAEIVARRWKKTHNSRCEGEMYHKPD